MTCPPVEGGESKLFWGEGVGWKQESEKMNRNMKEVCSRLVKIMALRQRKLILV